MAAGGKAAEGKVITGVTVQRLISDIWVAAVYFRKDSETRRLADEARSALTPLVVMPSFTSKEEGSIRKWQHFLVDLREANKEVR